MLEGELNDIDYILKNLIEMKKFYDEERFGLGTVKETLIKNQSSVLSKNPQLTTNGAFKIDSDKEIGVLTMKMSVLDERINVLDKDIESRNNSRTKLIELFQSLNSTDSLNFNDDKELKTVKEPIGIKNDINAKQKQSKPLMSKPVQQSVKPVKNLLVEAAKELPVDELLDFPVMEIREELDENGDVISSEIKPFKSNDSIEELLKVLNQKKKGSINSKPQVKSSLSEPSVSEIKNGIKEEIDEDGNIIKSSFKLNKLTQSQKEQLKDDSFRPFMIREEIDENGDVVQGSISQIPDLKEEDNDKIDNEKVNNEDNEQLAELLMDMGLKVEEDSNDGMKEEESSYKEPLKDNESDTHPITEITREMYKPEIDPNDVITLEMIASELMDEPTAEEEEEEWQEIGIEDQDVANEEEEEDREDDDDEEDDDDYDTKVMENMMGTQGSGLFMQKIMELRKKEAEKSQPIEEEQYKMKTKKSVKFNSTVDVKPIDNIWDDLRKSDYENQLNDIKKKNDIKVSKFKQNIHSEDNIGGDIIVKYDADEEDGDAILDIVERDIIEEEDDSEDVVLDIVEREDTKSTVNEIPQVSQVFINQSEIQNQMDNYQTNFKSFEVQKVGRKPISKFKMVRAANKGKEFQDTYVSPEMKEKMRSMADKIIEQKTQDSPKKLNKFKKDFKSLIPSKKITGYGKAIEIPKDVNPIINPNVKDEDFEIIRNETNEDLFDDDDEGPQEEFTPSGDSFIDNRETDASSGLDDQPELTTETKSTYFPKYVSKPLEKETEVVGATLDYSSLNNDDDSMAKAYVLGLYDDDIETEGQVIEQLDDFEEHNKEVETRQELHERVTELNDKSDGIQVDDDFDDDDDDGPMVATNIVEHDIDEINELNSIPVGQDDIELNDENLYQELANDYTNLRKKMIYKYKGGFKETDKELEFVQPDEVKRVSRFKAARLGGI